MHALSSPCHRLLSPCYTLQVPLGVLPKCETKRSEMIDIMLSLQQYVPLLGGSDYDAEKCEEVPHQILFGGDQLTAARSRSGQEARLNSDTCSGRLDSLKPVAEDWHTGVILLTVSIELFSLPVQ